MRAFPTPRFTPFHAQRQAKPLDVVTLVWYKGVVWLRASDLSGRARAMQSIVGGGMELAQAVAIAGLMVNDDGD